MLDIGWTELLVIAVILIVVVGPKDLPPMIRAFGKMTKRLRQTAGEFRAQFDEALREAELDDLKNSVNDLRSMNPTNSIRETLNPLRQMGQDIKSDLQKATRMDNPTPASSSMAAAAAGVTPAENSILPDLPTGAATVPPDLAPVALPATAAAQSEPASVTPVPASASKPRKVPAKKLAAAEAGPVSAPVKLTKPRASASKAVVAAPEVLPVPVAAKASQPRPASTKAPSTKTAVTKTASAKTASASGAEPKASAPVARKARPKKSEDRA
jgi:sec-independent protein translocase protein TatB